MIENLIKSDLTLKRWRKFKSKKFASCSAVILFVGIVLTFIAPILSNSRPLYLSYKGQSYFPVFNDYHPKDFGIYDSLVINYKKMELEDSDSIVWPPFQWDPFESNKNVESYPSGPTSTNILGTDDRGRDVFSRLLYGFKYSITYAMCVWGISLMIGTLFGGIMGFFGGKIDFLGQRFVEVLSTVPQFFLLIILISIFRPNLVLLVVVSCAFDWIGISYYVRAEFLKNRRREYVEAARSLGAKNKRIFVKHILPNSLGPAITFAPFSIAGHIVGLASLDFLGFGLAVPTPSWGELLNQASKNYSVAWWLAVYPSLALFITLTLLNLIGEGVRDAMDPNMK